MWVQVPVIEPITPHNIYEHTPLGVYKYGEYPKFIRPIGSHEPKTKWEFFEGDSYDKPTQMPDPATRMDVHP